ncbi:FAD/NAD(P)-binding domain-containing protein [Hypoxylon sp. FL1284]|nr:FAD/NAD(P)-binding domain-containing protein [Hypoxylon sp. FL1284]
MAKGNFRVIIVGGGPVGLTMAHTLSKAGIDFVVLERRPTIGEDRGASIIIHPHGLRVLSQVGLLDRLMSIGDPAIINLRHGIGGTWSASRHGFNQLATYYGHSAQIINRAWLVRGLYEGLRKADQAKVFTDKVVSDITVDDSGAAVQCRDGTRYEGSIVVGCDGVHSVVRKKIRALALQEAASGEVDEENPFLSTYRMMWCSFPSQGEGKEHGGPGSAQDVHGPGHSAQFLVGEKRSWMFVYERLATPTREPARYTQADVEAYADKWGDMPLDGSLRVRDMFAQRYHADMTNLDEGILRRWHSGGRLVLAGDAAHKFTPNSGLGYNNGIQDAAVLTNGLYDLLHPNSDGEKKNSPKQPSTQALAAVFDRYQTSRRANLESDYAASRMHTRTDAWASTLHWLWDQVVMPLFPDWLELWLVRRLFGERMARGVPLSFVGGGEPFVGCIPWQHPIKN